MTRIFRRVLAREVPDFLADGWQVCGETTPIHGGLEWVALVWREVRP